jgi:hypothetical protein
MPGKKPLNKYLTSKLQFSQSFRLNSIADSNYRGKCDVGGFLNFEWTIHADSRILHSFFILVSGRCDQASHG